MSYLGRNPAGVAPLCQPLALRSFLMPKLPGDNVISSVQVPDVARAGRDLFASLCGGTVGCPRAVYFGVGSRWQPLRALTGNIGDLGNQNSKRHCARGPGEQALLNCGTHLHAQQKLNV